MSTSTKLRTKLIVLFLLLSIIPLAVVGYLVYNNGRRTIEQHTFSHLHSVTILREAELKQWIEHNKRSLRGFAQRPLVRAYTTTLISHTPNAPAYQTAYTSIHREHFLPILEEEGLLELFLLRASDGQILISTDERQEGKYRERDPYFMEGKKATYVKNAHYSLVLEEAAMIVSTPVKNEDNEVVAVLAARVDLAEMSAIMTQSNELNTSEETYVVNKFNFFVTESRLLGPGYALKKAIHTEGVEACLQQKNGVGLYKDYRGVPVIGVYRWMPEQEMCILTEVDQAEAFTPIMALREAVIETGIVVAMIVILLAMFFSRTITRPVQQLVKAAEEIGRGNLDYRIETRTRDEIGQLTHAFDQMTCDLKAITASRDELNKEIAERKKAEEALRESKEAAEGAQKAAEAANRAKSEFLANMSHEFRTPLNGILGYAQILKRDPNLTEKQREEIDIIQRSGDHLLTLLNDILDLSKIEAGKLEIESTPFNLSSSLRAIVDMTRLRAHQKGVSFFFEEDPELPHTVSGDEKRLRQVLLNLLGNAVKFTDQGSVTLRVGYRDREIGRWGDREIGSSSFHTPNSLSPQLPSSPSPHLFFEVEDTGIGIPLEQIERIFSPFEQVKDRQLYSEGTGLGLTISRRLVRIMNSELHVKSTVGQGSVFWFDLDLPEVEPVIAGETLSTATQARQIIGFRDPSTATSTSAFSPELVEGSGQDSGRAAYKILVVDDKEANRTMLKDMLIPVGFDVVEAAGGQEAVDKAMEAHPDLILMDLIMPGMDGFEATRQIRELETRNLKLETRHEEPETSNSKFPVSSFQFRVPIIAVSASVFEQTQQKSLTAGCNDFLTKPVAEHILFDKLQTYLNIEWIYADGIDGPHLGDGVHLTGDVDGRHLESGAHLAGPIIPPPPEELSRLNELALIGDIMGIREVIEEIEALDPKFKPFVARARELAKALKVSEIQRFVEQYLEEDKDV